jgi:eukaryotic-like serine/threonine-protein kinase
VKPENSMCDNNEDFWLLDFGLARHLDLHSLTATGAHGFGTLGYSPPEQCLNQKQNIDARTDLFALGVTLYECATGVNPFRENTRDPGVILSRVKNQPLPLLSLSFASANEFRDLVAAMTQKRVDQRPGSAKEALDWIHDICKHKSIIS